MDTFANVEQLQRREFIATRTQEKLGNVACLTDGTLQKLYVHHEILPPGRWSSQPHRHTQKEECAYVISGTPSLWLDGSVSKLKAGDFVAFNPLDGKFHAFFNESSNDAVILVSSCNAECDETIFCDK